MNGAKVFLGVLTFLLLLSALLTFDRDSGKEIVENEYISCVVSVCIEDSTVGEKCETLPTRLSNVQVTVDDNGYTRITLSPTGIDCK